MIVRDNGQRGLSFQSQVPSAVRLLLGGARLAGWAIKSDLLGCGLKCQGLEGSMATKCVLLGPVLVLLWVSVAWAEVLVQPDFDAKKVSAAPVLCRGWAWGLRPTGNASTMG